MLKRGMGGDNTTVRGGKQVVDVPMLGLKDLECDGVKVVMRRT